MNKNQEFKQEHSRKDRERKTLFRIFRRGTRADPSLLFHATSPWDALLQFSDAQSVYEAPYL